MLRRLRSSGVRRASAIGIATLLLQLLALSSSHVGHRPAGVLFAGEQQAALDGGAAQLAAEDTHTPDAAACPICLAAGHAKAHSAAVTAVVRLAPAPARAPSTAPRAPAPRLAWTQVAPRGPPSPRA